MGCKGYGIDPEPGSHGVGRYEENYTRDANIVQAFAESIPFPDNNFIISSFAVFKTSSHNSCSGVIMFS